MGKQDVRTEKAIEEFHAKEVAANSVGLKMPEMEFLSDLKKREILRSMEDEELKRRIGNFKKKIAVENGVVDESLLLNIKVQYANFVENKAFKRHQLDTKKIVEKNDKYAADQPLKREWELRCELRMIDVKLLEIIQEAATWGISKPELDKFAEQH